MGSEGTQSAHRDRAVELLQRYRADMASPTEIKERSDQRLQEVTEPLKKVAQRLLTIQGQFYFLIQVCWWKIDYIAEATLHAIQAQNPISLAHNTRALIEHAASLTFIVASIDELRTHLDGQGSEEKINKALGDAEVVLRRSYFGRSHKKAAKKEDRAPHIESECLKAMERHMKSVKEDYDFLCEYVHPNYGSNELVSTGKLGSGRLCPPPDFHRPTLERFYQLCSATIEYVKSGTLDWVDVVLQLQEYFNRCCSRGAKINNVFGERCAVPQGDGKSKETAFHFPTARTPMEARNMIDRYLKKVGIQEAGVSTPAGATNAISYEIVPTSVGPLWFTRPLLKPTRPDKGQ